MLKKSYNVIQREGISRFINKIPPYVAKSTQQDWLLYKLSEHDIYKRKKNERDLNDIVDTIIDINPGYYQYKISAIQLREEIKKLAELVEKNEPETILEIGTANGGTLYLWSRYLNTARKLISLDLPGGRFGGGYSSEKSRFYENFSQSKDYEFVRDNSHKEQTFGKVSSLCDGEVDFLFVDGDHTYSGVKKDFEMYSELVSDGGIIAFHDIVPHPDDQQVIEERKKINDIEDRHLMWSEDFSEVGVHEFWAELIQNDYESWRFISHPEQTWGGIGVIKL